MSLRANMGRPLVVVMQLCLSRREQNFLRPTRGFLLLLYVQPATTLQLSMNEHASATTIAIANIIAKKVIYNFFSLKNNKNNNSNEKIIIFIMM